MRSPTRTRLSLTLSVALHAVALLVLALYVLVEKEIITNPFATQFVIPEPPPKPTVRKPVAKRRKPPKPVPVDAQGPMDLSSGVGTPRVSAARKIANVAAPAAVEATGPSSDVRLPALTPGAPAPVRRPDMPQVVTHAELPVTDYAGALAYTAPAGGAATGAGGGGGLGLGRQVVAGAGGPAVMRAQALAPSGISLVDHVGAELDGIGDMAGRAVLGALDVLPLPRGEPGGRVVGRGRDIRGVFRLVRVKHTLSDWWIDASALVGLVKWLNTKTNVKTDMNVEGGALALRDVGALKSPLLWMTGHDPSFARGMIAGGRMDSTPGGRFDNNLSDREAANLRRYLVDRRGLVVFDDCGMTRGTRTPMTELFLSQMRHVMPEHGVGRIPRDHILYNVYYQLGGPPVGFDVFWWGTRPPGRNYLEAIMIEDKLAVIVVRRDYMCAMETVSMPTKHYLPRASWPVMRWATNVVMYALTTGNISDYRDYVPEDLLVGEAVPTRAPQSARIPPTPLGAR
jgi:hypothetical protein